MQLGGVNRVCTFPGGNIPLNDDARIYMKQRANCTRTLVPVVDNKVGFYWFSYVSNLCQPHAGRFQLISVLDRLQR